MTAPMCPPRLHHHAPPPGCTFPAQRPSGYCGHASEKAYIGAFAIQYRCAAHASEAADREAIRLGYQPKELRVLATERSMLGLDCE